MKSAPRVAVTVPAYNESGRIERCLEPILEASTRHGWSVVVVDDGSTDDTGALARNLGAELLVHSCPRGVAAARNRGARHTDADILVFVDADVVAPVRTLEALIRHLEEHPDTHAVGAYPEISVLSSGAGSRLVGLRASMAFQFSPGEDIVGFSSFQSECGAIRREAFERIGGFSEVYAGVGMEEFRMGHDMERLGYRNVILGSAPYQHHYKGVAPRCRELFLRTRRWVPLLMERRRLESRGAVGSPLETASCALTHLMAGSALLALVRPRIWLTFGVAMVGHLGLEWRFFRLVRTVYGWQLMLVSWPMVHALNLSIGAGFAAGLVQWAASAHGTSSRQSSL